MPEPKTDQTQTPNARDYSETTAATLAALGDDIFKPEAAAASNNGAPKPAPDPAPAADKPKPAADDFTGLEDIQPGTRKEPDESDEEPKDLSEKAKTDWTKIRDARRKAEERAAAAERERDELKSKVNPEEVETLRKTLADYTARLRMVGLEKDPEFQQQFDGQRAVILAQAKKLAGSQGERVQQILSLPDSQYRTEQLDLLMDELPSRIQQNQIGALLNELDRLQATKEAVIERNVKGYDQLQERKRQEFRQRQDAAVQHFESKLSQLSDPEKGIAVLKEREGDKEWNSQVTETRALARRIFKGELQPEEFVRSAIYAATLPAVLKHSKAQQAKITELEQTITKLKSGQPGAGGEKDAHDEEGDATRGYADSVARLVVREGALSR